MTWNTVRFHDDGVDQSAEITDSHVILKSCNGVLVIGRAFMKQSTTNGKSYYGTSSIVVLNSEFTDTKTEELNSYILPKKFPSDCG